MSFGPFQLKSSAWTQSTIPPSLWWQCRGSYATYLTLFSISHRAPSKACFISAIRKMPHKKSTMNYMNNLLANIINVILPNGEIDMLAIANAYQKN